jgi:hypothetical protein
MSVLPWRKAQDLRITCITAGRSVADRHFGAMPYVGTRTFGDTPRARLRISGPQALLSCETVRPPSRGLRTLGEAGLG